MEIQIRKADFKDFKTVKQLMLLALNTDPKAFSVESHEYESNSESWWHSYIDSYLYMDDSIHLAYKGEDLVGMIGIIYDKKIRKKHIATIVWLYVKPEFRGIGVSKNLLSSALKEISNNSKITKISLMVNKPQVYAIKLYKKSGFKLAGTLKNELKIGEEYIDTIVMEKYLK
jgi:ribosomal protein S18 acetylase RimI-like enzyme